MSATGVKAFDSTLHTTHVWLNEIGEEMGWPRDPGRAYHAPRDRRRPDEAAGLAARMPLLVRGSYYEGWHPACPAGREPPREGVLRRWEQPVPVAEEPIHQGLHLLPERLERPERRLPGGQRRRHDHPPRQSGAGMGAAIGR